MFLWPSSFMTCSMFLVLWYSMVAFQCLSVWKWILSRRSFFSLLAIFLRCVLKVRAKCIWDRAKGLVSLCGRLLSMVISCFDILIWRGSLPFSGVMFTNCFSVSISVHCSMNASPLRAPVL